MLLVDPCAEEEIPPSIFYPVVTCPYKLFPGETRPLTRLLSEEVPFKHDIEFEHETEEKDEEGKKIKKKVVIPYAELCSFDINDRRSVLQYFLRTRADLKLDHEKDFNLI